MDGTTALYLRVNVGNHTMDTIFDATSTVDMLGNALSLHLDLRNTAGQSMFIFSNFLWCTGLTAPNPVFGGGVFATGWTATVSKDMNTLDLSLVKN